ncbi:MAG: DUF4292 domain-containing protein [Myxococcaceae bacterium]|nr:DUF4292 domain-containing protein [Myxococcaceae bacterium]
MTRQHTSPPFLSTLWLAAALWLMGCPKRPLDLGPEGEARSAAELLKRIAVAESQVVSMKGDAKLRVESPGQNGTVTLFVAVTHPAYVHLEALGFFNQPQAVLVSDGEKFGMYDAQTQRYYRGPATAANMGRFLPVVLPPDELAALMLGRSPRIPAEETEMSFDAEAGVYWLTLKRGGVVQKLTVQPPSYRVVKSEVTGMQAYNSRFEDIEDVGPATYPRRVVLEVPGQSIRVELNYKDVTVNEAPDLTLFEMSAPANVPVVDVDAQGKEHPVASP